MLALLLSLTLMIPNAQAQSGASLARKPAPVRTPHEGLILNQMIVNFEDQRDLASYYDTYFRGESESICFQSRAYRDERVLKVAAEKGKSQNPLFQAAKLHFDNFGPICDKLELHRSMRPKGKECEPENQEAYFETIRTRLQAMKKTSTEEAKKLSSREGAMYLDILRGIEKNIPALRNSNRNLFRVICRSGDIQLLPTEEWPTYEGEAAPAR